MTQDFFSHMSTLIKGDDVDALTAFIEEEPTRLTEDTRLGTALHYAAWKGTESMVSRLIELGANVNFVGKSERTPLHCAIVNGNLKSVELLLNHGGTFDIHANADNPYITAIAQGHIHLVRYFLEHGIDPHVVLMRVDGTLRTAYSFAVERGETEIADLLAQHGCKPPDSDDNNFDNTEADRIVEYVANRFGDAEKLVLQSLLPDGIFIHYIRPNAAHPFATVFTTGMSSERLEAPEGKSGFEFVELLLHLPPIWPDLIKSKKDATAMWPLQVMRMIALYARTGTWLGSSPTFALTDPPQPLGPNTAMSAVLLKPQSLDALVLTDGKRIDFYTVYPIYSEELAVAQSRGVQTLVARMAEANVSAILDVGRVNSAR